MCQLRQAVATPAMDPKSLNESDSTRVCGGVGSYYEGSIPKSWMAFQYDVLWLLWFETKNVT